MKIQFFLSNLIIVLMFIFPMNLAEAQIDPSSSLLLKDSTNSLSSMTGSSGRYKIKTAKKKLASTENETVTPKEDPKIQLKKIKTGKIVEKGVKDTAVKKVTEVTKARAEAEKANDTSTNSTDNNVDKIVTEKPIVEVKASEVAEIKTSGESKQTDLVKVNDVKSNEVKMVEVKSTEKSLSSGVRVNVENSKTVNMEHSENSFGEFDSGLPITEQLRDILLGGSFESLENYQKSIHPDDMRRNKIEIELMPMLIYNDSNSNFWYRDYSNFTQGLHLSGKFWLTPFFGLNVKYLSSIGGDVVGGSHSDHIPLTHQWTDLGVQFRRFYGITRKAPSLEFGMFYSDYQFKTSSDNLYRPRLRSSGLRLDFTGRFPSTPGYAWLLGLKMGPKIKHQELETGININSGNSSEQTQFGFLLGGEFIFSRESEFIWSLEYDVEKDLYTGDANMPNPGEITNPSGVSVVNSFVMFKFGYRWGK